jgi:hypothetical protein
MLKGVQTRLDRCSTERIMGLIFSREFSKPLKLKSIFGDIMKYEKWGYSYDEYEKDFCLIIKLYIVSNVSSSDHERCNQRIAK